MLGCSNMKDLVGSAFNIGTSAAHATWAQPENTAATWYYLLNTYNLDPANAQVVDYNFRMTAYCLLTGANFLPQTKLT